MLKNLAMLGICFLLVGWQDAPQQKESSRSASQRDPQQTQRVVPPRVSVIDPTVASPPGKAESAHQAEAGPRKLYGFLGPEWMIVWVTIIYTFTAWLTLRSIKRQAHIMETQAKDARDSAASGALKIEATLAALKRQADALEEHTLVLRDSLNVAQQNAEAALLNAQAAINAERPWILALLRPSSGMFEVIAENRGRTPAFILESRIGFVVTKTFKDLPDKATYTRDTLICDKILLPGRSALILMFAQKALRASFGDALPQFPEDGYALVIGRIIYRDLLNPDKSVIHETRWVSWYQPSETGAEVHAVEGIGLSAEYERYT